VPFVAGELGDLEISLTAGLREVERWLVDGPLGLSREQVGTAVDRVSEVIRDNLSSLAGGAITGATVILEVLAGLVLTVVVLFFFLKDGDRMWGWTLGLVPRPQRDDVRGAGERAYSALAAFLRAQTLVALFDATFIGLALVITGVPLALPLTVLTFFAAYIPFIGAFTAGAAAVLVALVALGPTTALIVLAAIVAVQQLEGNVIEPLVMGRALNVHPVIVVVGVTAGGVLGGIVGAAVATPVLAAASGVFAHLRERTDGDERLPRRPA
jgi:predicted PurR-regulated permease PerM